MPLLTVTDIPVYTIRHKNEKAKIDYLPAELCKQYALHMTLITEIISQIYSFEFAITCYAWSPIIIYFYKYNRVIHPVNTNIMGHVEGWYMHDLSGNMCIDDVLKFIEIVLQLFTPNNRPTTDLLFSMPYGAMKTSGPFY